MRLGIDLMAAGELDRLGERGWFRRYIFAESETAEAAAMAPSRRREFLAGRFAAKEAVLKVLGRGLFQGVRPADIRLAREPGGAPSVCLGATAAEAARAAGLTGVTVSLTHKADLVAAVAVGW
ncbi:MAG TPA: 4'-phosphopantetheinyl transferase superfamily protein [Amycolatopsis sp.]|nr:4'-phosphopantetheinyl transferase superfamily protein [Amycolatopsis sp.]